MAIEQFNRLPEAKRLEILNVAIEEFSQFGYDSASTNHIVARAGISKGVLFKYFSNKEQLFLYLCDYVADRQTEWLRVPRNEMPTEFFAILRFFALRDLQYVMNQPLHHAFLEQVNKQADHPVCQKAIQIFRSKGEAMYAAIIDTLPQDQLRRGVTMVDAMNFIGWVFYGFNQSMREKVQGNVHESETEIIAAIDKVLDLVKHGIHT